MLLALRITTQNYSLEMGNGEWGMGHRAWGNLGFWVLHFRLIGHFNGISVDRVSRWWAKSARMFVCLYQQQVFTVMAVPKKKTSKSKKNMRKATWKRKAVVAAQKALSLGKSVLTGRSNSFVYPGNEAEDEE